MDWIGFAAICITMLGSAAVCIAKFSVLESKVEAMPTAFAAQVLTVKEKQDMLESKVNRHGEDIVMLKTQVGAIGSCAARESDQDRRHRRD